jgi:hypothetical protein
MRLIPLVLLAACGGGGMPETRTLFHTFDPKLGNWNTDNGCQISSFTFYKIPEGYFSFTDSDKSGEYSLGFTTDPNELIYHGEARFDGKFVVWDCTFTCVSATTIGLKCTSAVDGTSCESILTKAP